MKLFLEWFLLGLVVPLPQEEKTYSLAGFHPFQNPKSPQMWKNVSWRLRSPCSIGENAYERNEVKDGVGADEVKADRVEEEEEKEENVTAEKVMEEK